MGLALFLYAPVSGETVNQTASSTASATTIACALNAVGAYDVIIIAISATKAFSSITDNLGGHLTYTQQAAATLATGTVAAQTYIYTAPNSGTRQAITVTVTWATTAQAIVVCYDTAGWGGTAAHSSTGTGALSSGTSVINPAVGSYTPTTGNFEISVYGGSTCGGPATITGPASTTGSTFLNQGATATACQTSPATNFYWTGGSAYYKVASGSAQTDGYSATGTQAVNNANTADWAEAAIDMPANVVSSQSIAETNTLVVHNALRNPNNLESNALHEFNNLAQAILVEAEGLTGHNALAQANNNEVDSLCVSITVNSVPTFNGCQTATITVQTSPANLANGYFVNGVAYSSTNSFTFAVGATVNVTAAKQAGGAYQYKFVSWSGPGISCPFQCQLRDQQISVPLGGGTYIASFSAFGGGGVIANCAGPTPFIQLTQACWLPAVLNWYAEVPGMAIIMGILLADVDLALFIKTRSAIIAVIFFTAGVSVLGVILPGVFPEIAYTVLALGIAGFVYRLYSLRS